jgi:hypothetical protein
MKTLTVTLLVSVEVSDGFNMDSPGGYNRALDIAAQDISTRSKSEIADCVEEIMEN